MTSNHWVTEPDAYLEPKLTANGFGNDMIIIYLSYLFILNILLL